MRARKSEKVEFLTIVMRMGVGAMTHDIRLLQYTQNSRNMKKSIETAEFFLTPLFDKKTVMGLKCSELI